MKITYIFHKLELLILGTLILFLGVVLCARNIKTYVSEHYAVESYSLIRGHFDLIIRRRELYLDTLVIDNKVYFAGDPGTAWFLLPLAAISALNDQVPPQWPINLLAVATIAISVNQILKRQEINKTTDRIWLIICFVFATPLVSVIYIPNTWNIAQTVGIAITLVYLSEWLGKKRGVLLLPLILLAGFTRKQLLLPITIFSVLDLILSGKPLHLLHKQKQKHIWLSLALVLIFSTFSYKAYEKWYYHYFAIPIGLGASTAAYNLPLHQQLLKEYGQFNLFYLPKNIYYYFLKGPEPVVQSDAIGSNLKWPFITASADGIGFFFLSPIFMLLFLGQIKFNKSQLPAAIASLTLGCLYLTFFTTGSDQFGLRYSADIIPFLFLLLLPHFKGGVSSNVKFLITMSSLFNAYLLIAFYASGRAI